MDLRTLLLSVAALGLAGISEGAISAPFCVVTAAGPNCSYFYADACRNAAAAVGGMCVANSTQAQSPQLQTPDIMGSFMRGQTEGAAQRRTEEEHKAKLQLLQAQTEVERARGQAIDATAPNKAMSFLDQCKALLAVRDSSSPAPESFEAAGGQLAGAGYCYGYIDGVVGGHSFAVKHGGAKPGFCLPENVTAGQIASELVSAMDKNPQVNPASSAFSLVLATLTARWPCQGK